jgi:hypothetical protein
MKRLALILVLECAGCFGAGGGGASHPTIYFDNCGPDCGLDKHTVAAGGAFTLLDVAGAMFTEARATNPAVAQAARNTDNQIEIISGAPGATEIEVLNYGRVVASATLTVEATAKLVYDHAWSGAAPVILENTPQFLHVTTMNASGTPTKGSGAVSFSFAGTVTPSVVQLDGDAIGFAGTAGDASITGSCPSTSVTVPLSFVPASAVTRIDIKAAAPVREQALVTIVPQSASGPVYTGSCQWHVSDPSVTLEADPELSLDGGPGRIGIFNLTRPGTFTISCTLVGQTVSIMVQR